MSYRTASSVRCAAYLFIVQKHFELVEIVPPVRFFGMHVVEIIAGRRSERVEIEIGRQQQRCWYFLSVGYGVALVCSKFNTIYESVLKIPSLRATPFTVRMDHKDHPGNANFFLEPSVK